MKISTRGANRPDHIPAGTILVRIPIGIRIPTGMRNHPAPQTDRYRFPAGTWQVTGRDFFLSGRPLLLWPEIGSFRPGFSHADRTCTDWPGILDVSSRKRGTFRTERSVPPRRYELPPPRSVAWSRGAHCQLASLCARL